MITMKTLKPTNKLTLAVLLATGAMTLLLQGCNEEVPVTDMSAVTVVMPLEDQDGDIQKLAIAGGRLYDHWMDEINFDTTTLTKNSLMTLADNDPFTNVSTAPVDTHRCKNCHGWDYKGADGQYDLTSSNYTGFPGILGASEYSIAELIDFLTNGKEYPMLTPNKAHDFDGKLSPDQINELAHFIKYGTLDTTPLIGRFTKTGSGDEVRGEILYAAKEADCARCHGADGKKIPFGTAPPEFVGTIGVDNPWEMLHKIRFGQPGTEMLSTYRAGLSTQDAVDIMTHTQTLEE